MIKKASILLHIFCLHIGNAIDKSAVLKHIMSHCNKDLYDINADLYRLFTTQYSRKHSYTLFGESCWSVTKSFFICRGGNKL